MSSKNTPTEKASVDRLIAEARDSMKQREKGYRDQALKLFPWICAKCGREFSGKRVRELTVHHKDHNHDHNPPDGSNWELLCLYCHDNEHSRYEVADAYGSITGDDEEEESGSFSNRPFSDLAKLLKEKKE